MKKLTLFLGGILLSAMTFAQSIEFTLNKALTVGCGTSNPLTDMTKKVDVVMEGNKGTLTYASINCKKTIDGINMGVVNQSTQGTAFLDDREKKGFIIEKNEKVILFSQKDGKYQVLTAGHIDKKIAKTLNPENDQTAYADFFANIDKLMAEAKKRARNEKLNAIATADSLSTVLDQQEILKDSRGMSGIYYSTFPIKLEFSLPNKEIPEPYAKKFLVNYNEKPAKPELTINSQYAYEATDRTKFVKRAIFWVDDYWKMVLNKKGVFATNGYDNVDNDNYEYFTHTETTDLQGNSLLGEDRLTSFEGTVYEAEPGILLIVGEGQNNLSFMKDIDYAKKFGVIAILYKAEKAEQVKKYTNDYCWDVIKELNAKIDAAGYATNETLPVEALKDPKIKDESFKFAKEDAAKNHPKEQVQYTYIASKEWNIIRDKQSGVIVKRSLRIIVVVKMGENCAYENASIYQNYDGSSYGPSYWVPAGAPVYIDCKQLNTYK